MGKKYWYPKNCPLPFYEAGPIPRSLASTTKIDPVNVGSQATEDRGNHSPLHSYPVWFHATST